MDLCAEMLRSHLGRFPGVSISDLLPPFHFRFRCLPFLGRRGAAFNLDRLLNRFVDYPRRLHHLSGRFDSFHVCDHSYSQLVHELPPDRTGVFCHDLDTFRSVLSPRKEPRPGWFRRMMRKSLDGFRKAAVVFHSTRAVREQILTHGVIDESRLVHAPYGISPEFRPEPTELDREPLPGLAARPFLLHVGSCIPRKRIDVLLRVFAEVRRDEPELLLVQVGGEWTTDQRTLMGELNLNEAVVQVRGVSRETIAALARRTRLTLLTSEAEGFGLPLVEAMACGSVVVASDIPVLREVGGEAAIYAPVADIGVWSETVRSLLSGQIVPRSRENRLTQAGRYSWESHARTIIDAYRRIPIR